MKYVIIIAITFLFSCKGKNGGLNEINLDLKNTPAQMVYLKSVDEKSQPLLLDSANYKGTGAITLHTKVIEPSFLNVIFSKDAEGGKYIPISTNNGEIINISGDYNELKKVTVTGSESTKEILNFLGVVTDDRKKSSSIAVQLDSIVNMKKQDSLRNALQASLALLDKETFDKKVTFARNSKSPVNAIIGLKTLNNMQEIVQVKDLMDSLHKKHDKSTFFNNAYTSFQSFLNPPKNPTETPITPTTPITNGTPAKEISMADVNGKTVTLSSFRGKYVLIDFWASWCGPCRGENPNVVNAYNKFKNKNFTILGVSLDKDKAAWLKAIADDKLAWTQVSDLKWWQNQAARDYGVESIPANYLIDPNGNIIATELRGADLHTKLEELLK